MSAPFPHCPPSPGSDTGAGALRRGWRQLAGAALLLGAGLLAAGCHSSAKAKSDRTVEVEVTTPISDNVLNSQDFTGRIDAFRTVDIKPRVNGYVDEVLFVEGDKVQQHQVLYVVNSKPYAADYKQASANLELAIAERKLQVLNAARARVMRRGGSMGQEEFDQIMASRDKASASVGAMEAAKEKASIYLGYTQVRSPISGIVSRRIVDPGNLVKADETLLTTVVSDDQVYAYFDVDERTYLNLVGEKPSAKPSSWAASIKLPVQLRLANAEEYTHSGVVDFVDNRLNGNTGTIRMRALVNNPNRTLKSGLFVRVRLPVGAPEKALLIPDEALQSDQGKKYVYVVNKDNVVEYREVKFKQAIHGLRVIEKGLKLGERVIVTGQQQVRQKAKVDVKMLPPPKAPPAPLRELYERHKQAAREAPRPPGPAPKVSEAPRPPGPAPKTKVSENGPRLPQRRPGRARLGPADGTDGNRDS
jgi:RND family efflux transporter MFP subunit